MSESQILDPKIAFSFDSTQGRGYLSGTVTFMALIDWRQGRPGEALPNASSAFEGRTSVDPMGQGSEQESPRFMGISPTLEDTQP